MLREERKMKLDEEEMIEAWKESLDQKLFYSEEAGYAYTFNGEGNVVSCELEPVKIWFKEMDELYGEED